jgi:tRNA modification GTPase
MALEVAQRLVRVGVSLQEPEAHGRAQFGRVLDTGASVQGDPSEAEAPLFGEAFSAGLKPSPCKAIPDEIGMGEATGTNVAEETQIRSGNDKEKKIVQEGVLDEAIVTAFHGPRSYTGDDLVEIAAHGSPVVLEAILRGAMAWGERMGQSQDGRGPMAMRLANPGEFTQRAFLAGRLDLTQAEAVHDLIAAQTLDQARVAAQQMGGALSRRVAPAKEQLLHLIALLEAGMDFASGELDDVDVVPPGQIAQAIAAAQGPLVALAATFQRGQLLRNGAAIALVGAPNAGKSSLFNRLLERERAIVTPIAGTTRDTLEETLALGGIPVRLIDTAGLRAGTTDEVETLGMERTQEALADADLVLYIEDVSRADEAVPTALLPERDGARPYLVVQNKIDLLDGAVAGSVAELPAGTGGAGKAAIRTSALTGAGLEELRAAILAELQAGSSVAEGGLLNNLRQQQAVTEAVAALDVAATANREGLPHELILVDLHTALRALDALTGATSTEDILARIFSTFCIGK